MVKYDIQDVTLSRIAGLFEQRRKDRRDITLAIDPALGEFCGKIEENTICAGSYAQLLDTAGRFLRNPEIRKQTFLSHKKVAGVYFCTHFQNYLDAAPLEEVFRYIEDLAFWGMNHLKVWFDMHHFKDMEEGRTKAIRLLKILEYAHAIGLKTCLCILANEAFDQSPQQLRADWTGGHDGYIHELNDHYHVEICPSRPGGMELILEYRRKMLEVFAQARPDYIEIGAYDEGGCSCRDCAPWGCNGFLRTCEKLIPVIREYMPDVKINISMWQFGTFTGTDVEFEGVEKALKEGRLSECVYLVAEPQYAKYPFEHDMHRPLIHFPEISMYGAVPWGGYGANPLPGLMEKLWRENEDKLEGGFPYCEGIYPDINEVIMLRLYRDNQPAEDTIREYLIYEFGLRGETLEKVLSAIMDMEETLERTFEFPGVCNESTDRSAQGAGAHRYIIAHPRKVFAIEKAIADADKGLSEEVRKSIRWQLIYLRAMIDAELVRNHYERNEKVLEYFKQIVTICHLEHSGMYTKPDIEA